MADSGKPLYRDAGEMRICCVCGARPNFMKIAAVSEAMEPRPDLERRIVHTGQHYDRPMYQALFEDLGLSKPDVDLGVGSASHAVQTAMIMERFEPVLLEEAPDLVLVVGDTNSTLACALVAAKLHVPVAHVEAGLRSFDRSMPEEINRVVTDAVSDLLFVSEPSGLENLRREGAPEECTFFVGNVMIDALLRHRKRAQQSDILERCRVESKAYAVLTLHRPANVDDRDTLSGLLKALEDVQARVPVVFPAHPRTLARLKEFGLLSRTEAMSNLQLLGPLGYLDFLRLMGEARVVLTDSGGIQEETTILGVPCLTLRENTERPATVESGLNQVVGRDPRRIREGLERVLKGGVVVGKRPEKWDGHAGERIVQVLLERQGNDLRRQRPSISVVRGSGGAKPPGVTC